MSLENYLSENADITSIGKDQIHEIPLDKVKGVFNRIYSEINLSDGRNDANTNIRIGKDTMISARQE